MQGRKQSWWHAAAGFDQGLEDFGSGLNCGGNGTRLGGEAAVAADLRLEPVEAAGLRRFRLREGRTTEDDEQRNDRARGAPALLDGGTNPLSGGVDKAVPSGAIYRKSSLLLDIGRRALVFVGSFDASDLFRDHEKRR